MPKPNLPKAKPRKLPQAVLDSLNHRHGFHVSSENSISQNIAKKLATAMTEHKLCAVSISQLKLHLEEVDKMLMESFNPEDVEQMKLNANLLNRRKQLARFLKEKGHIK